MINIQSTLDEKFPGLSSKPIVGQSVVSFLRYLCHESEFKQFAAKYPHLEGFDFIEQSLDYFDFSYRISDREKEHIPAKGKVVIAANHPIGSLDGLALLLLVATVRRDVKVVANELLYSIEPLRSLLLPVDNINSRTRKQNLKAIQKHLVDDEGALIIFPAGEVSRFGPQGIRDGRWNPGFLKIAKQTESPILPMHIDGRNSVFFYALSLLAKPISTLWLVREMFKQANHHIDVRAGHMIYPEQLQSMDVTPKALAKLVKKHVYKIAKGKKLINFSASYESIAHPEDRQQLKKEIKQCQLLGETQDGLKIVLYRYSTNSVLMREIGRLRELTFRGVKEGTGLRRDIDRFDSQYDQLVLWDEENLEVAGAYRMRLTKGVSYQGGDLYSQTLFDLQSGFQKVLDSGLELGRSFVQPAYQGKRSLDYLWYGIGAYVRANPDIRYMFGPVSISQSVPDDAKSLLVQFYDKWFSAYQTIAIAKMPYVVKPTADVAMHKHSGYEEAFKTLKEQLKEKGGFVPPLYKQYTQLCESGGVQFTAFNVDPDFSNCVDGLIVVDLAKVKPKKRKRYLGE